MASSISTAYYSDVATDSRMYDETDLLKDPPEPVRLWSGLRNARLPDYSEAVTLFVNSDGPGSQNLPGAPDIVDEVVWPARQAGQANEVSGLARRAPGRRQLVPGRPMSLCSLMVAGPLLHGHPAVFRHGTPHFVLCAIYVFGAGGGSISFVIFIVWF